MSLDVYLTTENKHKKEYSSGIFIRENGETKEISEEEWNKRYPNRKPVKVNMPVVETHDVYSRNITHNLGQMADLAGLYLPLWRPEEKGWKLAKDIIEPLEKGLKFLKSDPALFQAQNPENGWGSYEGLVEFTEEYLQACKDYPEAVITVSR